MAASTAALSVNQARKVYPYLLRELVIDHPNRVWATDSTYIPMVRSFAYLIAIIDWRFLDAMVSAHGTLRMLAVVITKIANDSRRLASGPRER